MDLLIVKNEVAKPQDNPNIERIFTGIDHDGSERELDLQEFEGKYLVLVFLPLDCHLGFEDILYLKGEKGKFEKLNCQMVGVTSESPYSITKFIEKPTESGYGFGGNVGFPIICDKRLSLSMKYGVGVPTGMPAKSSIILDPTGQVRHISIMSYEVKRSTEELARLVSAYQESDFGLTLKANWTEGSDGGIIPNDFEGKKRYYMKYYDGWTRETNNEAGEEDNNEAKEDSNNEAKKDADGFKKSFGSKYRE